jgi:hypothetical protein
MVPPPRRRNTVSRRGRSMHRLTSRRVGNAQLARAQSDNCRLPRKSGRKRSNHFHRGRLDAAAAFVSGALDWEDGRRSTRRVASREPPVGDRARHRHRSCCQVRFARTHDRASPRTVRLTRLLGVTDAVHASLHCLRDRRSRRRGTPAPQHGLANADACIAVLARRGGGDMPVISEL